MDGGKEIVVTHSGPQDHAHEDAHVAIRDAFLAATRQLEDHMRKRRGQTKAHDQNPGCEGIAICNHGLFTFGGDARQSYEKSGFKPWHNVLYFKKL